MRLSIIVPVYNVEQYLLRCLDSLFEQGLDEKTFEVVIVNDGSPDQSLAIAEGFSSKHNNVKIVSRPNGGLSAARNTGLEHAAGEYVWFVDSDDFIEPDALKPLLSFAMENELDALCFNLQLYFDNGRVEAYKNPSVTAGKVLTGEHFITSQMMPPAAVLALYRREHLLKYSLKFREGILHEDQEFTPRAYCLAQRIAYVDKAIYNYYQREGSIMKSGKSDKRVTSLLAVCDSLYDFSKSKLKKGTAAHDYFTRQIAFVFSQALFFWGRDSSVSLNDLRSKPYYPLKRARGLSMKDSVKISLMNLSIPLYKFVVNFL